MVALALGGGLALLASSRSHHSAATSGSASSGTTSTGHAQTFTPAYKKELDALLADSAAARTKATSGDYTDAAAQRRTELARCKKLPAVSSPGGSTSLTQLLCKALSDSLKADLLLAQGSAEASKANSRATAAKTTFVAAYVKACKAAGLTPSKYANPKAL